MAENVEQIESQLAAYVDGELSGEEKLEIEKHLASNPGHRALISDLIAQKAMVQKLPSEPAPGDLTEGIQFQLEREVLLASDPLEEARRASMRINRLPQILSMAAVAVLTAGLGVVVYSILPPRHPVAKIEPTAVPSVPETDALRGAGGGAAEELVRGDSYRALGENGRREPSVEEALGTVRMRSAPTGPAPTRGGERAAADRGVAVRGGVEGKLKERPAAGVFELAPNQEPALNLAVENAGAHTVVLTVNATDVEAAREQILAYLKENQIAWQDQPAGGATPHLSRLAQMDPAAQVKKSMDEVAGQQEALFQKQPAAAQAEAEVRQKLLKDEDINLAKEAREFKENVAAKQADGGAKNEIAPTPQGTAAGTAAGTSAPPAPAVAKPDLMDKAADMKAHEALSAVATGEPVVVANLNGVQVQELAKVLSAGAASQSAVVQRVPLEVEQLNLRFGELDDRAQPARFMARRSVANAPATLPADGLISPTNTGLTAGPASRPANNAADTNNFAFFGANGLEAVQQGQVRGLEIFQCVIVLKTQTPATQPSTRPTTQPSAVPATQQAR